MTNAGTPQILLYFGEDFTKITFSVDLTEFNVDFLAKDIVQIFSPAVFLISPPNS
ncbi:hypothetical protein DAPPUDRAFT_314685 [Daphnia pulex]|uniref:Uncharacterized protein n=1 Tax=Daphnia pulex TaxID=6669 RepID=E9G747_DAPPU|nr:hypothetical protein DAPPUDRAFT_314685 [Daphnia pulex]|eukprot:EFX84406.1 hypothetical protein DAPPUDRAFT_314685 [Daphnia pulex]